MRRLGIGVILIVAGISFTLISETVNENILSLAFAEDEKRDIHSFKIFTGDGPPPQKLGHSNDLYIDQESEFFDVYVKNEVWELVDNLQGPQGPQGSQGPKGEEGTKISSGNGDPNGVVFGNAGDFFVDTETGALWQLGDDFVWSIQGNLKGPKGDVGEEGPASLACWDLNENGIFDSETEDKDGDGIGTANDCQGPQGEKGEKGDPGSQGPQGDPGSQGNAGFNSVVLTTPLGIGDQNCQDGGIKIEIGLDSNNNNQLDIDEINPNLTQFICNGSQGPQGEQGPPGPAFLELPISHYRFEQNVLDSEGGNHGTVTGTENYVPGQKAFAFDFDGSTFITLANENKFDFEHNQPFSISVWVKPTEGMANNRNIIAKSNNLIAPASTQGYGLFYNTGVDGRFILRLVDSSDNFFQIISTGSKSTDTWWHIAVTYSGNSNQDGLKIYVNGILENTGANSAISNSILNNQNVVIGAESDGGGIFTGQIDDALIFNTELTDTQVAALAGS